MKRTTVHQAKTHFLRVLAQVEAGEETVVSRGGKPVARIVPYRENGRVRPKTGTITSGKITCSEDFFTSLTAEELKEWGL